MSFVNLNRIDVISTMNIYRGAGKESNRKSITINKINSYNQSFSTDFQLNPIFIPFFSFFFVFSIKYSQSSSPLFIFFLLSILCCMLRCKSVILKVCVIQFIWGIIFDPLFFFLVFYRKRKCYFFNMSTHTLPPNKKLFIHCYLLCEFGFEVRIYS